MDEEAISHTEGLHTMHEHAKEAERLIATEKELAAADHEKQAISHTESRLSATERTLPFEEYRRRRQESYDASLQRFPAFVGDDAEAFWANRASQEEAFKDSWKRTGLKCGRCNNNWCECRDMDEQQILEAVG